MPSTTLPAWMITALAADPIPATTELLDRIAADFAEARAAREAWAQQRDMLEAL